MPQVENEDLAMLAYNCFAEYFHWLEPSGLGPMMRWEALRDDLRMGYGKMVTCVMEEMQHRESRASSARASTTQGMQDTHSHGAPPAPSPSDWGATGDPVPPGARGGGQGVVTPNVPRTGPHPEESHSPTPVPQSTAPKPDEPPPSSRAGRPGR